MLLKNSPRKANCTSIDLQEQTARMSGPFDLDISLTMSYFHTGIRTIIGAEAFHCPVRDGKEWDHLAMVIRLNWLPSRTVCASANLKSLVESMTASCCGVTIVLLQQDPLSWSVKIIGSSLTSN